MCKGCQYEDNTYFCTMQVKPYNVYVTVAYPPDTDTPGFAEESKTKVNCPAIVL